MTNMVHRASATDWRASGSDDEENARRAIDIRVLNHQQKCSGFDTLAVLDQLEPPTLQYCPSRDGGDSSVPSEEGSQPGAKGSRCRFGVYTAGLSTERLLPQL